MIDLENAKVAVIGLGYVGLPLAVEFGKQRKTVGRVISKGDIVIYESTVCPGATEDDCIPVIEQDSVLKAQR